MLEALRGGPAPELAHYAPARVTHPQHESSTYRYCTNFAITGSGLDPGEWVRPLERLGDSVLVVGDATTLKVHLHTNEPEQATALFSGAGEISRLDVADMLEQVQDRSERLAEAPVTTCGVLAVVAGDGYGPALRKPRRDAAVRRPDAQPVHLRAAGRHPRRPGRAGRRAAELAQRA